MAERMFDKDSFTTEVTSKKEAQSAVKYLASNEIGFLQELASEGLGYDESRAELKTVWTNLLKRCAKVGFKNYITEHKAKEFGVK